MLGEEARAPTPDVNCGRGVQAEGHDAHVETVTGEIHSPPRHGTLKSLREVSVTPSRQDRQEKEYQRKLKVAMQFMPCVSARNGVATCRIKIPVIKVLISSREKANSEPNSEDFLKPYPTMPGTSLGPTLFRTVHLSPSASRRLTITYRLRPRSHCPGGRYSDLPSN